jgi:hypothetical protein
VEREREVRTWKEVERVRGTHFLENAEHRGMDKSGHRKERNRSNERGTLTSWRARREGQISGRKESGRAGDTYELERREGGTNQDGEKRDRWKGTHSLESAEEGQVRTRKERRMRVTHSLESAKRDKSIHGNKASGTRDTHCLQRVEGGILKGTKERRARGHSLPGGP